MHPTTVSLFCGAGGESLGKHLAFEELGISVEDMDAFAVNHWDLAVTAHGLNLPWVQVRQEDLTQVTAADFGLAGKPINLLWASPSCVHFSRARGGRPKSDQQRSHAWEVVDRWLKVADVDVMLVENVPEFKDWGPLYEDHSPHCHAQTFANHLYRHGRIAGKHFVVKCAPKCRCGTPIKARKGEYFAAFVQGLKGLGYEVEHRVLCAADYGDPTTRRRFFLQAVKDGRGIHWPEPTHRDPKRPAGLFDAQLPPWKTAAECIDWSIPCPSIFDRKKPLAEATLKRIAAGVVRYVLEAQRPFLVNLTHGGRLEDMGEPFKTITGANRGEKAVIAPSLLKFRFDSKGQRIDVPMPTITAGGTPRRPSTGNVLGLMAASMVSLRGTSPEQILASAGSVEAPVPTVSAGGGHAALCTAFLAKHFTGVVGASLEQPMPTVTGTDHNALVAATMIQTGYGEREGQAPRILDIEDPLGTVVAGGVKHGLVAATLLHNTTGHAPGDVENPLPTVTTGNHHGLIAANLIGIDNQSGAGVWPADAPLTTATGKARHALVAAFISHYYGQGTTAQDPSDPLHTVTTLARHGLVTVEIDGETFVVVDIGMRMLEPKELARAMSFPDWYRWEGPDGKPLTKRDQVKMIGNAVPTSLAKALVMAVVQPRPEIWMRFAA